MKRCGSDVNGPIAPSTPRLPLISSVARRGHQPARLRRVRSVQQTEHFRSDLDSDGKWSLSLAIEERLFNALNNPRLTWKMLDVARHEDECGSMPTHHRQTRATPIPAAWKREPVVTIESAFGVNSPIVASPEEVAEQERLHSERLARDIAVLDNALVSMWSCRACGVGNAMGSSSGLCGPCTSVAAVIRAEQRAGDDIGGRSRRELVLDFLTRQS